MGMHVDASIASASTQDCSDRPVEANFSHPPHEWSVDHLECYELSSAAGSIASGVWLLQACQQKQKHTTAVMLAALAAL